MDKSRVEQPADQTSPAAGAVHSANGAHPAVAGTPPPSESQSVTDRPPDPRSETRLTRWQRRLLDLSLHNRLLNFKSTRRTLELFAPDAQALVNVLCGGATLKIVPSPKLSAESLNLQMQGRDREAGPGGGDAASALRQNEVIVDCGREALAARLIELYRTAKTDIQEGGANTLFLVVGFLRWRREDRGDRSFLAPLVLLPVTLQRTSVRSGVRMTLHEDEPRFNTTLLEMLRQDFHLEIEGLDGTVFEEGSGIGLERIFGRMQEAVADLDGFEIVPKVVLGTFSFAKYLMWKDLVDRADALMSNTVVRHLVGTPRERVADNSRFPPPARLDDDYPPDALSLPLPADSSQLSAVAASAQGTNFVLIGPPGTGKSQTIANIIGQNLAAGRTVLFVSEKIAALDVVYRRLRDVGLGDFCLELHSAKSRKVEVLEQLKSAWNAREEFSQRDWQREARRLETLRSSLNVYVRRLHRRYRNGLTPFVAMSRAIASAGHTTVRLSWPSPDSHGEADLDRLRDIARRLDVHAKAIGGMAQSAFELIGESAWSPGWQHALSETAARLKTVAGECHANASALLGALRLEQRPLTLEQLRMLKLLAIALPQAHSRNVSFALGRGGIAALRRVDEGIELLKEYRRLEPRRPRAGRTNHALMGGAPAGPDNGPDPGIELRLRQITARLDALAPLSETVPGWRGLETDARELSGDAHVARRLLYAIAHLGADTRELAAIHGAVRALIVRDRHLLAAAAPVGRACAAFAGSIDALETLIERLSALARSDVYEGVASRPGVSWLKQIGRVSEKLLAGQSKLNAWCGWRRVRDEAVSAGLAPIVQAIEQGELVAGEISDCFEAAYCRWWAAKAVEHDPVLCEFVSAERDKQIRDFRELDERFLELTARYIRARICAEHPDPQDAHRHPELGMLRRELEKKTRHKAVRQLISEMPTALARLTPCLLMSPLSVAQYLNPRQAPFDVVVFDEASQITIWDAVGAIARGRQTIVVGDPKQLPPTSFFSRSEDDDDEENGIEEDLESILDECLGGGLPACRLRWHYRSEHESLIAFSNHRYYGGELVTFPSPFTHDRAVRLVPVPDGVYGRGDTRTNRVEAKAVVGEIVRLLKDPAFAFSDRSLGVVTFNVEQQRLIEDLLDEERLNDPSIERFFSDDRHEPLFVKNLESVQGDERDLILFSVTYGPDVEGHVSMNFGPMNREGGERRLNVAVTRARRKLLVFASLRSEQIDLARAPGTGVRDFKQFLEYAERGSRQLAESIYGTLGDYATRFESAVARSLSDRGWVVHPQIGVSEYRVGLAVVHPDAPNSYLAGIECDGDTYRRGATARDRDKLREQILHRLGWRMLRVWSIDWWIDGEGAAEALDARLHALLGQSRLERTQAQAPRHSQTAHANWRGGDAATAGPAAMPETLQADASRRTSADLSSNREAAHSGTLPAFSPSASAIDPSSPAPLPRAGGGTYAVSDPSAAAEPIDPENFFDSSQDEILRRMIEYVITVEGPVRDDLLVKRIVRAYGFKRTGRKLRDRVLDLTASSYECTRDAGGTFYWPRGMTPNDWTRFREPQSEEAFRAVSEICFQELASLARYVAAVGAEDPAKEMALKMGLSRIDSTTRRRLEDVLSQVLEP